MSNLTQVVTAAELERYPGDDFRYELVRGRVIRMSPVAFPHGSMVMRVGYLLIRHLRDQPTGTVVTEVGFKLASNPDTVRAPDIAFVRMGRTAVLPRGFFDGPPDMALEVLSPDDRPADVREKVDEYLACGVELVVVVDPDEHTVVVHRPGAPSTALVRDESVLNLDPVFPGFSCRLVDIFA